MTRLLIFVPFRYWKLKDAKMHTMRVTSGTIDSVNFIFNFHENKKMQKNSVSTQLTVEITDIIGINKHAQAKHSCHCEMHFQWQTITLEELNTEWQIENKKKKKNTKKKIVRNKNDQNIRYITPEARMYWKAPFLTFDFVSWLIRTFLSLARSIKNKTTDVTM